jgi:DEAD/DEAH box helicase domain-containing protein
MPSATEKKIRLIDNNGAPRGERNYIVYNPPVVNSQLGIRASAVKESAKIGAFVLQNKVPAIIFARSRVRVEVISTYLRQQCPGVPLAAYRGGYLPNERRLIERGLREGTLQGVVSTNALELGIDIGMLDAVITTGYPGSISSLMQQFGRAGRRGEPSLAIMVATSSPLDQYIAGNPDFVVSGSPEGATVNPDNLLILMDHIKCAAFELPFSPAERFATHLSTTAEMLAYLEEMGVLKRAEGRFHWMSDIYPAGEISLRTASQENFVIMEKDTEARTIGEVDFHSAPTLIHQDAIYMHQGRMYYIDELDWERRLAYCHELNQSIIQTPKSRPTCMCLRSMTKVF